MRRLLRRVVRQLIAYGVTYPTVSQLLKELYVEVAEDEFALPFKRQTDSRLALVTGIHRKEIAQLRRKRPPADRLPEVEDTVITHVIGKWLAGPPYAGDDGTPHCLAYEAAGRRQPCFAQLVRELEVDIPVRAVLDELLRLGAVELRPDGQIELRQQVHVPSASIEGKLSLLGSDPAELFATIVHNIEHADDPWVQRKVVYDNVGSEALAELRSEARKAGEEFVRRANTLLASYDRDRNPGAPGGRRSRVALGVYYFEEGQPGEAPTSTPAVTAPPGRIRRSQ